MLYLHVIGNLQNHFYCINFENMINISSQFMKNQ